MTFNVHHAAGDLMKEVGKSAGLADEGGFWPDFEPNEEVIQTVVKAIERGGYEPGRDFAISLDIAASDLYDEASGRYESSLRNAASHLKNFPR